MKHSHALFLLAAATWSCGGDSPLPQPKAPDFIPAGQTKCRVRASSQRPLVVEWPAADRATLESSAKRGLIPVRYDGCEVVLLPQCHAKGSYTYAGLTRKSENVRVVNADDLYASLPIGAAKLEAKLATAGELNVAMTLVGTYTAPPTVVAAGDLDGIDCDQATHVVAGLTVGAFDFYAGASVEAGAEASALGVGAGASSKRSRETLSRDGDLKACLDASSADTRPPGNCGAVLRIEVVTLGAARPPPKPRPSVTLSKPISYFWQIFRPQVAVVFSVGTPKDSLLRRNLAVSVQSDTEGWLELRRALRASQIAGQSARIALDECAQTACDDEKRLARQEKAKSSELARARKKAHAAAQKLLVKLRDRFKHKKPDLSSGELLTLAILEESEAYVRSDATAEVTAPDFGPAIAALTHAKQLTHAADADGWWVRRLRANYLSEADPDGALAELRDLPYLASEPSAWGAIATRATLEPSPAAAMAAYVEALERVPSDDSSRATLLFMLTQIAYESGDWRRTVDAGIGTLAAPNPPEWLGPESDWFLVDAVVMAARRLGGLQKVPMLAASPEVFGRIVDRYATTAIDRGDVAAASGAYEALLERSKETIYAPQAVWGLATISEWQGDDSKVSKYRSGLAAYRTDSPWAAGLRKRASGAPAEIEDKIRKAVSGWQGQLPNPPGAEVKPDDPVSLKFVEKRLRDVLEGCSRVSRAKEGALVVAVEVFDDLPTKVSVEIKHQEDHALSALRECVFEELAGSFSSSPFGVSAEVHLLL